MWFELWLVVHGLCRIDGLYLVDLIGVQVMFCIGLSFKSCMSLIRRWTYGIISIIETFLRFSL